MRGLPPLNEDAKPAVTGLEAWRSIYEKDVAMMEKSVIEPGRSITFTPGGLHLMIVGLSAPLEQGDKVAVTLKFERPVKLRCRSTCKRWVHRHQAR